MIAACPKCSTRYRVDAALLGGEGARLRCRGCQTVFRVRIPGPPSAGPPSPRADSGRRVPVGAFVAVGLIGALLGGTAVWLAPGGRRPAAAPETTLAARRDAPAAPDALPPPPARAEVEAAATQPASPVPQAEERAEAPPRPLPPRRTLDPIGRATPRDQAQRGEPRPMLPGARRFYTDRARTAALSFVDVAEATVDRVGTADEEEARRELSQRFRNAVYFAPEELKDSLRRLYQATKTYGENGENDAREWDEARQDLLGAIDRVR